MLFIGLGLLVIHCDTNNLGSMLFFCAYGIISYRSSHKGLSAVHHVTALGLARFDTGGGVGVSHFTLVGITLDHMSDQA